MNIRCRAHISPNCYGGKVDVQEVYGPDGSMADDGTYDGKTVICDPCYIVGGQPSLPHPSSQQAVIEHVNREMGIPNVGSDGP